MLLVEPDAGGHHFIPYAAVLARVLGDAGIEVGLLTTPAAARHPAMEEFLDTAGRDFAVHLMPEITAATGVGIPALMRAQASYWRSVREGWRRLPDTARPDCSILLGLDSVDRAIAIGGSPLGQSPFVGLTIQTKYHWPALGIGPGGRLTAANRWSFRRVLSRPGCLGVVTIDESLVAFEARCGPLPGKVRFVPDPGEVVQAIGRSDARSTLGLDPSVPLVLAYGGLNGRKNVGFLLQAAVQARSRPLVVLAGAVDPEVRVLADSPSWRTLEDGGRLLVMDGFASLEREACIFGAADLAWVGYRSDFHGQSAVIPLAASAGVPLIGRRGGLIGATIERHGLGETVDPANGAAVAAAIDRLAEARRTGDFGDNLRSFAESRSHAAYGKAWFEALGEWWGPPHRSIGGGKDA